MEKLHNDPMLVVMNEERIPLRDNINYLVESKESIFDRENKIEIGNLDDYLEVFSGMEDI